jgi:hypothetical protein
MEKPAFTRACLSGVRVIVMIMHVPLEERLCQKVTGWVPVLKCLLLGAVGACGPVLLCQAFNAAVTRRPCPSGPPGIESLGAAAGDPGLFQTRLRGGSTMGGQVVKSSPSVLTMM